MTSLLGEGFRVRVCTGCQTEFPAPPQKLSEVLLKNGELISSILFEASPISREASMVTIDSSGVMAEAKGKVQGEREVFELAYPSYLAQVFNKCGILQSINEE